MKLKLLALTCLVAVGAHAQTSSYPTIGSNTKEPWSLDARGGPAIYDPTKGPVPDERKYVLSREGGEEQLYKQMNPGASQQDTVPVKQEAQAQQTQIVYVPAAPPAPPAYTVPSWVLELPRAENMIFGVGIGVSFNEQMALDKARLNAERKIIQSYNSEVESLTKSYVSERDDSVTENTEVVTQKISKGNLAGVQRLNTHAEMSGNKYKFYVLMALPLGDSNPIVKLRQQQDQKREAEIREKQTWDELQRQSQARQERLKQQEQAREQQIRNLAPQVLPPVPKSDVPIEQSLSPGEKILVPEPSAVTVTPEPMNGAVVTPIPNNVVIPANTLTEEQKKAISTNISDPEVRNKVAGTLEKPNAVYYKTTIN